MRPLKCNTHILSSSIDNESVHAPILEEDGSMLLGGQGNWHKLLKNLAGASGFVHRNLRQEAARWSFV